MILFVSPRLLVIMPIAFTMNMLIFAVVVAVAFKVTRFGRRLLGRGRVGTTASGQHNEGGNYEGGACEVKRGTNHRSPFEGIKGLQQYGKSEFNRAIRACAAARETVEYEPKAGDLFGAQGAASNWTGLNQRARSNQQDLMDEMETNRRQGPTGEIAPTDEKDLGCGKQIIQQRRHKRLRTLPRLLASSAVGENDRATTAFAIERPMMSMVRLAVASIGTSIMRCGMLLMYGRVIAVLASMGVMRAAAQHQVSHQNHGAQHSAQDNHTFSHIAPIGTVIITPSTIPVIPHLRAGGSGPARVEFAPVATIAGFLCSETVAKQVPLDRRHRHSKFAESLQVGQVGLEKGPLGGQ